MDCPRCRTPLIPHATDRVVVDACVSCRGAFYEHLDQKTGLDPDAELQKLMKNGVAKRKARSGLACPLGHGPLVAFDCTAPDGSGLHAEIDHCGVCKGMWLDDQEGQRVRVIADQGGEVPNGVGWYFFQLFSGLPLEVYHPVKRRPVVIWLLVAACIAAFVVELSYAGANALEPFIQRFGLVPKNVLHGYSLISVVTHMFLHGGFGHIFGNLAFLYIFGDNIEDRIGRMRFLLLYLACGLAAAAAQISADIGSTVPMVGASGAIAGILGAYLVLFPRVRVFVMFFLFRIKLPVWFYLGGWIAMNLLMGSVARLDGAPGGVAWWAHVGGFFAGALWALVMRRRILNG
jgi:membrane associated rhomboid family serine protease